MSVLGKIREKSSLLLIIIGGALAAFVLGDLFSSGNLFFDNTVKNIAVIGDAEISPMEFDRRLRQAEENYMLNTQQSSLDESTRDMIFNETWNQLVKETIMNKEFDNLGLVVTAEELYDMVRGKNPHPSVKQSFTNPNTGVFDPNSVLNFLKSMDDDATGDSKSRWVNFEKSLKKERFQEKYNNLVKKGLYVPSFIAKNDFLNKNQNVSFNYIFRSYADVADTDVKFTDSDLKKYYNNNLKKYEQEAYVKLEYLTFDVEPSNDDMESIKESVSKLYAEFKEAEDDSLFVLLNSNSTFDAKYYSKEKLSAFNQANVFDAEKGTFFEPYIEGGLYKISKLRDVKVSADSVKARHILLGISNNDTTATKAKADSIISVIKKNKNFEAMVSKYSEDTGSASEGGSLGWFSEGVMVKPFEEAAFSAKKGQITTAISQFGYHIIEVTERSGESKKVQIATVEVPVEPSSTTYQLVYAQAGEFATKNNDYDKLKKSSEESGKTLKLVEKVTENDKNVQGLTNSREIVRWAFKAKEGQVSMPFELEDQFVIVVLKEQRKKGFATFEQVKADLELAVIKEKKAEKLTSEINALNAKTLEEIAQKFNVDVKAANNINFNSFSIPGAGRESKVIGMATVLSANTISQPIDGENGVYVIYVTQDAKGVQAPTDVAQLKTQVSTTFTNRVDYELFEALKKQADVKDNRAVFY
jgi:peptidyl-prolyl cis-trans isomerase D